MREKIRGTPVVYRIFGVGLKTDLWQFTLKKKETPWLTIQLAIQRICLVKGVFLVSNKATGLKQGDWDLVGQRLI